MASLGLCLILAFPVILAAQDSSDKIRQPGLWAEYQLSSPQAAAKNSIGTVARWEPAPTLLLAADESPDSRLPATGWKVRWTGVIEVLQPGSYQFAARAGGRLIVRVGGTAVLNFDKTIAVGEGDQEPEAIAGQKLDLAFGLHSFEVEFQPAGVGAELKLFWQSEHFAREPLGARSVGHAVAESEVPAAGGALTADVLLGNDRFEIGRLAFEEHNCVGCHRASAESAISQHLATRPGPHLTHAGDRLKSDWIYRWLGDPQSLRPEAVMPRLFAKTRTGEVERQAVATFLSGLKNPAAKPPVEPGANREQFVTKGKQLFERTGCVACHTSTPERMAKATLRDLGQKTTAGCLAQFLENPAAIDPAGRMPDLKLTGEEALAIASYLTDQGTETVGPLTPPVTPAPDEIRSAWQALGRELTALEALPPEQQLAELGKQVMHDRRCTSCHELKAAGEDDFWRAQPAQADFAKLASKSFGGAMPGGCLATPDNGLMSKSLHPIYPAELDRVALGEFLAQANGAVGAKSPGEAARLTLARFNCLSCHERDGIGGLAPEFVNLIGATQSSQEAELVKPPTLSGITEKLIPKSLDEVLTGDRRSRPWMSVRMPHFGRDHVGHLAAAIATWEGTRSTAPAEPPQPDSRLAEAGRQLVGSQGFGCIKCHDLLGRASGGTRGPDLAQVSDRIQYDWYLRWMTDPQRIETGTRMPTVFLKGESPYPGILDGDPEQQRQAIWQYLIASRDLPLPDGFEQIATTPTSAGETVLVARTFLPDVSPRSLAIRFPSQLHLIYDAQSCRLAGAWHGPFLDMTPVWTERGGRPARFGAELLWRAPAGFPWDSTSINATELPDFAGRGADPVWGAPLPDDAQLHPSRIKFRGYRVDAAGVTFRYDARLADDTPASFTERLQSYWSEQGGRLRRELEVSTPEAKLVTLFVADSDQCPEVATDAKEPPPPAPRADADMFEVSSRQVIAVSGSPGKTLFCLSDPSADARWRIAKRHDRWLLYLQVRTTPTDDGSKGAGQPARAQVSVEVLLPSDAAPASVSQWLRSLQQGGK